MCVICVGAMAVSSVLTSVMPSALIEELVPSKVETSQVSVAAIPGITGTKCVKVGAFRTSRAVRHQCKKSAQGLRWVIASSNSVSTSSTSTSTTTTTTIPPGVMKVSCGAGLADCPTETATTVDIGACKISDATPGDVAQGFPRPPRAKPGKPDLNVLVIPVRYANNPVTEEQLRKEFEREFQNTKTFFERNSYKRVTPFFTLESESQWVSVAETAQQFIDARSSDLKRVTQDIVSLIPRQNIKDFDSVFIVAAGGTTYWGGMDQTATYKHSSGDIGSVYFQTGPASNTALPHNLGHTAYYFEDLYIQPFFRTPGQNTTPLKFDAMSSGNDYVAWNRWLAGFLYDSEVTCLRTGETESIHRLTHFNSNSGKKLSVIPLGFGRAIFIEYNNNAIHIYELNSYIGHGAGPIKTIDTLQNGQTLKYGNFEFTVVALDQTGAYIKVKQ